MKSNGPAVGFSKRYPTQAPGRVLIPRPEYSGGKQLTHIVRVSISAFYASPCKISLLFWNFF